MTNDALYFDAVVVGGGLAGLTAAILIARGGFTVAVLEKESYPLHKVCGEYISYESWDFLESLGLPLSKWDLPRMDTVQLSTTHGGLLQQKLPLGGFGVSRYKIDAAMMHIAKEANVHILEDTKVQEIQFANGQFEIDAGPVKVIAKTCCGTFGKRANLDVKWKRPFVQKKQSALSNYIGVKYHARLRHPRNLIALHHFPHGYCGVAAIEDNKTNICYLATAQQLRDHNNDIAEMERAVLWTNPLLRKIFSTSEFLFEKPLVISQISFEKKEQSRDHMLFAGDAAGMIAPLCGNGMSMAIAGARIAAKYTNAFLQGYIDGEAMEKGYANEWQRAFANRLRTGRLIQRLFDHSWLANAVITLLRPVPALGRLIISQTHGKPFR